MSEEITRLQEVIRQICLKRDTWDEGSVNNDHLQVLCKELITYIDSEDKLSKVMKELPNGTHEIIKTAYITYRISKINTMDGLLDALEKNPNAQGQIIKACEKELATYIKTAEAERLGAVLIYTNNNSDLYRVILDALQQPTFASIIESVDNLNSILKMLPEEMVPTLGKDLIELFTPLFKTRKHLASSLAVSKNTRLQEAFIDALYQSGRLANLIFPGSKKAILKHFQNNPIYYDIIKKELKSDYSFRNILGLFSVRREEDGGQITNAENQCERQLRH